MKLNLTFTKEEVEAIRRYASAGVDCAGLSCSLCPFDNMYRTDDKYQYALEHMEK